jgi:hypothetical protein
LIERGLEQTTDARRGGGRGEQNKKKSVEQWIDAAVQAVAMGPQMARATVKIERQRRAHARAKKERQRKADAKRKR